MFILKYILDNNDDIISKLEIRKKIQLNLFDIKNNMINYYFILFFFLYELKNINLIGLCLCQFTCQQFLIVFLRLLFSCRLTTVEIHCLSHTNQITFIVHSLC